MADALTPATSRKTQGQLPMTADRLHLCYCLHRGTHKSVPRLIFSYLTPYSLLISFLTTTKSAPPALKNLRSSYFPYRQISHLDSNCCTLDERLKPTLDTIMSPYDNAGRIHKRAFLVSNLVLFAFCLISSCARFYIRICVQKSFSTDDGVLLFGVGCLIAAMGLLFHFIDEMYLVGATESGTPGIELPSDFIQQAFDFQKFVTVALTLTWCSIVSVKFSYLFLFKKLIDRLRPMVIYWWFVAVFNAIVSAYGAAVYFAACPDFYSFKSLQCAFGKGVQRSIAFSISQMILDIIGDLLILFIPCQLIWKVKIRWTQKVALSFSLCLTVLTIICTITRISGIHTGRTVKSVDSVWETYWQFIAANLALTMTAVAAFRTFFVSRAQDRRPVSPGASISWYTMGKRFLRSVFTPRSWRSKPRTDISSSREAKRSTGSLKLGHQIPRGTMTGIRTFINGQGKTNGHPSQGMHSVLNDEYGDSWPLHHLSTDNKNTRAINVQRDITMVSQDLC